MKKNVKRICLFTIILLIIIFNFNYSLSVVTTTDNGKMYFCPKCYNAFDIKGYVNGKLQSTTFMDGGYEAKLKVGSEEPELLYTDKSREINGVSCDVCCYFVNDGRYVKSEYSLTNNNAESVTISLGVCADIQIAGNDRATVERFENSKGLKLYDNDSNIQFNFYGKSVAGTTNIDNLWIGEYPKHEDNVFNGNTTNKLESKDSTFAFSWINRTIEAGDTKKYSVILGIGEVSNAPKVELDSEQGRCFSQDSVLIKGTISDQDANSKATIHYIVDSGEEKMLEEQTLNNNLADFSLDLTSQNLSLGTHNIKIWAIDEKGNPSEVIEKQILITNLKAPVLNMSEEWTKETVKFTITDTINDSNDVSKYQYKIEDGAWTDIALNEEAIALNETGTATVRIKAVGKQNEEESTVVSKTAKVDKIGPTINVSNEDNKITILATDEHSGTESIKYNFSTNRELSENETFENYNGPISYPTNQTEDMYLHIIATDKLENESTKIVEYKAPIPVEKITLNKKTLTLKIGETEKLITTIEPENATNKNIKYSSSDEKIATVDSDGNVTAVKEGTVIITATTEDGEKTDTCTVTVIKDSTIANQGIPDAGKKITECIIFSILIGLTVTVYINFKKYKEI